MRNFITIVEAAEPPRFMFHGTNRDNRDSILKHGLRRADSETAQEARSQGEEDWYEYGGIFFSERAADLERGDIDVWKVDTRGLRLEPDETTSRNIDDEDYDPWWVTRCCDRTVAPDPT